MDDYVDLTDVNISLTDFKISASGYDCHLRRKSDDKYFKGFILAKSEKGKSITLCDVRFNWSSTDKKYPVRLTFKRTNENLQENKVARNMEFARVAIDDGKHGYKEFWKMIAFLTTFKDVVDIGEFMGEFQVASTDAIVTSLNSQTPEERQASLVDVIEKTGLEAGDLADVLAIKGRKADLEVFRKLIVDEKDFRAEYRKEFTITKPGDEPLFHHFLKHHKWIFGSSLRLKFIEDLADEQSVGTANTEGRGDPEADLLGYSDYTVLIELKTPDADIFKSDRGSKARANTWSFTSDFIEGFSQCLAQKTDWEKASPGKSLVSEGKELDRGVIRTIDPQAIYIMGNKEREIPRDSVDIDIRTKRDTLERFIRNNRNINIISYDELYFRAYYIVYDCPPPDKSCTPTESGLPTEVEDQLVELEELVGNPQELESEVTVPKLF